MSPRRSRLAVLTLAAGFAVPATAAAAPAPATTPKAPTLGITVDRCDSGLLPRDRVAVFTASMPTVPGTETMAMRFDLEERDGLVAPFVGLLLSNFGRWERSAPDVAGFVYSKRVEGLGAPAAYRVKVRFRWLDAGGATVRATRRTSPQCRQDDPRPDLRVSRLRVGRAPGGDGLYSVTVRNAGASDAGSPFVVTVGGGGLPQQEQEVAGLAAGDATTFVLRAPHCTPGAPVVARVDTARAVDEADERDNVARTTCPA